MSSNKKYNKFDENKWDLDSDKKKFIIKMNIYNRDISEEDIKILKSSSSNFIPNKNIPSQGRKSRLVNKISNFNIKEFTFKSKPNKRSRINRNLSKSNVKIKEKINSKKKIANKTFLK